MALQKMRAVSRKILVYFVKESLKSSLTEIFHTVTKERCKTSHKFTRITKHPVHFLASDMLLGFCMLFLTMNFIYASLN